MSLTVLVQLCGGIPLFVLLCCLGLILSLIALYLAVGVKRIPLLVAFLPLTTMPMMAGVSAAFMGTLNSISVQLNPATEIAIDPGFLLLMNIVPILFGVIVAIPSALITLVARWVLTWKASEIQLLKKKAEPSDPEIDEDQREANDYLRELVRPR